MSFSGEQVVEGRKGTISAEVRVGILKLLCTMLVANGFAQGFLIMDLAFDFDAWAFNKSEAVLKNAFSYYLVILNNKIVAFTTIAIILVSLSCSYLIWKRYRETIRHENYLSKSLRRNFTATWLAIFSYLLLVLPRYLIFMGHKDLEFDPSILHDWGSVMIGRVLIISFNMYIIVNSFPAIRGLVF
jgi:hypothetical protein